MVQMNQPAERDTGKRKEKAGKLIPEFSKLFWLLFEYRCSLEGFSKALT